MPTLILSANRAEKMPGSSSVGICYDLRNGNPFPTRRVEIKTAQDAADALEQYKIAAQATLQPLAISLSIENGHRAPRGFKALQRPYHRFVNI